MSACVCIHIGNHFDTWGGIASKRITLYGFFLYTKMHVFKKKAFSIHFDRTHQIIYLNSVLLKGEEEQGKEEKAFLLKLLS